MSSSSSTVDVTTVKMSKRGKRGVSKCKKKSNDPDKSTIEFNENGLAIGENAALFKSCLGLEFRKRIPYYKLVKDIDKKLYNDLWEHMKVSWNIPNDDAKSTVMKEGKVMMRNFRHTLVDKYVKKGTTPFQDYEYLDASKWDSFVSKVKSKDYQEKSQKAKMSAEKNVDPARLGRMGFAELMNSWEDRWNQLVSIYPYLSHMQDERSKIYTVSRAHYNPVTKLRELGPHLLSEGVLTGRLQELYAKEKEMMENGTYYEFGKDVVTEVVGKGRQHGGRTRLVSHVIGATKGLLSGKKKKSKEAERIREEIDAMERDQNRVVAAAAQASSNVCLPEIESTSKCDLIWPFNDDCPDLVLGHGMVYSTSDRTLHGNPIHDDYVKVHVDLVNNDYLKVPVPPLTRSDEVIDMQSAQGTYIQWPRKAIKLCSSLPVMATPREAGPWGADGGKSWDDGVFSSVKQVRVHLGELNVIYALQFEYLKKDGNSVLSQAHGGADGSKMKVVDFDGEKEFLTGVSGYYGPVEGHNGLEAIASISFHTNKKVHGPFGKEKGAGHVYFTSTASAGKVVGFQGRSNRFLSAIGVHMEYF